MELGLFFQIADRIQLNCIYKESVLRIDHSCAEGSRGFAASWAELVLVPLGALVEGDRAGQRLRIESAGCRTCG